MSESRYVQRNENGEIVSMFGSEQENATELLSMDHPDIKEFIERINPKPFDASNTIVPRFASPKYGPMEIA